MKPTLESKYKIKFEVLSEPGDTIWFLKRKLRLISADQLLVTPHPKYVERLVDLLKVGGPGRKKTPLLAELEKISADSSQSLSEPHAKIFRQCVGILLYVATDYVDCQYTIGLLASKMSNPSQTAMKAVRHLVSYMQGIVSAGILISNRGKHTGLLGNSTSHEGWVEPFSDSNWAADQVTRKSTSAGCICVLGNVLHTSSRSQRVIALSSGEAELLASAVVRLHASSHLRVLRILPGCSSADHSSCGQHCSTRCAQEARRWEDQTSFNPHLVAAICCEIGNCHS